MSMRKCWEVGMKDGAAQDDRWVWWDGGVVGVEGGGWLVDGRLHKKLAGPLLILMCWMLPVTRLLSFH